MDTPREMLEALVADEEEVDEDEDDEEDDEEEEEDDADEPAQFKRCFLLVCSLPTGDEECFFPLVDAKAALFCMLVVVLV